MNATTNDKVIAGGGAAVSWIGWMISHVEQINAFLQMGVLILSAVATLIAIRAGLRKKS